MCPRRKPNQKPKKKQREIGQRKTSLENKALPEPEKANRPPQPPARQILSENEQEREIPASLRRPENSPAARKPAVGSPAATESSGKANRPPQPPARQILSKNEQERKNPGEPPATGKFAGSEDNRRLEAQQRQKIPTSQEHPTPRPDTQQRAEDLRKTEEEAADRYRERNWTW